MFLKKSRILSEVLYSSFTIVGYCMVEIFSNRYIIYDPMRAFEFGGGLLQDLCTIKNAILIELRILREYFLWIAANL